MSKHEQTISKRQQTSASCQQPAASSKQPATTSQQPTASSQQQLGLETETQTVKLFSAIEIASGIVLELENTVSLPKHCYKDKRGTKSHVAVETLVTDTAQRTSRIEHSVARGASHPGDALRRRKVCRACLQILTEIPVVLLVVTCAVIMKLKACSV